MHGAVTSENVRDFRKENHVLRWLLALALLVLITTGAMFWYTQILFLMQNVSIFLIHFSLLFQAVA
jgi:hypothetical protein